MSGPLTEAQLRALATVQARQDVEDHRGLDGAPIRRENGPYGINRRTAASLEWKGLVEVREVAYATSEDRVFLTEQGREALQEKGLET